MVRLMDEIQWSELKQSNDTVDMRICEIKELNVSILWIRSFRDSYKEPQGNNVISDNFTVIYNEDKHVVSLDEVNIADVLKQEVSSENITEVEVMPRDGEEKVEKPKSATATKPKAAKATKEPKGPGQTSK